MTITINTLNAWKSEADQFNVDSALTEAGRQVRSELEAKVATLNTMNAKQVWQLAEDYGVVPTTRKKGQCIAEIRRKVLEVFIIAEVVAY